MDKRTFLVSAAAAAAAFPAAHAAGSGAAGRSPVLLTVTGAVDKVNRAPFDPALDQMMVKQKVTFQKAHVFEFAQLAALPRTTLQPTLEYDGKRHRLAGPLLVDVLRAAGAPVADSAQLLMRAVDGYAPAIGVAEARRRGFIVATHLDGKPLPLGGLGPLWAVYEPDRFPDMAAKPVTERFALCPWGLYHIEVKAA